MTLEKFTIKAQETVQQAVLLAQQNGQQSIEPVHLMAALLDKGRCGGLRISETWHERRPDRNALSAGDSTPGTCSGR